MKINKRRILLVDDDVRLNQALKTGLEACGFEVRSESASTRVLEVVRAFRPDLIVLDIVMPGKEGGEVAQELGGQDDVAKIPIIFLTSLTTREEVARAEKHEETILGKPVSILELQKCINAQLARNEART